MCFYLPQGKWFFGSEKFKVIWKAKGEPWTFRLVLQDGEMFLQEFRDTMLADMGFNNEYGASGTPVKDWRMPTRGRNFLIEQIANDLYAECEAFKALVNAKVEEKATPDQMCVWL